MYTIQLRRGNIEDLKELLPVIHEELYFTKDYITPEEIDKRLSGKRYSVWLAQCDLKSVGTMVWYEENPEIAYAWLGVIQRDYQNKGIGNLLLNFLLNDIINFEYEKVWTKVGVNNTKALNMFMKYDFNISRRRKERNNEIFILEKKLG